MSADEIVPALERQILISEPGFYPAMTSRQYFAEPCPAPALTNSGIKILLGKTPADFAYDHPAITPDSPEAASNAAKRLGDVCHQLTLGKGAGFRVGPFAAWNSTAAKAFKAEAEAEGLTPVKQSEFDDAVIMAALMKTRIADTLRWIGMQNGQIEPEGGWPYETEVVMAWIEQTPTGPVWCRAMMDVWCQDLWAIIDPKFTDRFYGENLQRQMVNMGWDFQSCWYRRGVGALIPGAHGRVTFTNIMVSPKAPHVGRTIEIEEAWRYSCQLEIDGAVNRFATHLKAGIWPGFGTGIETLYAPEWLLARRLNANPFTNDPIDDNEDQNG